MTVDNKEVTLTLTVKETDTILALIAKQPLAEVIELFNKIRGQAIPQLVPEEPPSENQNGG